MSTIDEVDESLAKQIRRHETLKEIIKMLDALQKDDDEGREWVLDQLAEG